jgi:hypothetical protein
MRIVHQRYSVTPSTVQFEPRASWSQQLLRSHNAAIVGQFSKFELHEVHRISQTGHNLGTLTGGSIAVLHHGDPLGNCAIFLHTVRPVGETI